MAGIIIPGDRTKKQPVRAYCMNPECRETSTDERFEFDVENDKFACPKCGNDHPSSVGVLALVHFLVKDPKGPIRGGEGRYRLACDAARVVLATNTNREAASGMFEAVNCPGCLKVAIDEGLAPMQGSVPRFN